MDIQFVEALPPKATGRTKGRRQVFVETLKQFPGQWAIYPCNMNSSHPGSPGMFKKDFPGVEVAVRTVDDTKRLFVRWVGDK